MEHVDELGSYIGSLIREARTKQEIALADYRTAVDEERKYKRLDAEYKELERIRDSHHEVKMSQAYEAVGIRR